MLNKSNVVIILRDIIFCIYKLEGFQTRYRINETLEKTKISLTCFALMFNIYFQLSMAGDSSYDTLIIKGLRVSTRSYGCNDYVILKQVLQILIR